MVLWRYTEKKFEW